MCSLAIGEPSRWSFGTWHQQQFINGECKFKTIVYSDYILWNCEFSDGCIAGWISDISGAHQRGHRWLEKVRHGKLI